MKARPTLSRREVSRKVNPEKHPFSQRGGAAEAENLFTSSFTGCSRHSD